MTVRRFTLRELIILIITVGMVATLVLSVLGLGITKLVHPELDLLPVARVIGQTVQIMLGVVVGYLAGTPYDSDERS